jgi:hypothetical protein
MTDEPDKTGKADKKKPEPRRSDQALTAVAVMIAAAGVAGLILLLLGQRGVWQRLNHEEIFYSLVRYTGAFFGVFATYQVARIVPTIEKAGEARPRPIWIYLQCVAACGVLAFILGSTLGTHVEDADPYRGGGETVTDFEPTDLERLTYALKAYVCLLIPALFGTQAGLKDVASGKTTEAK